MSQERERDGDRAQQRGGAWRLLTAIAVASLVACSTAGDDADADADALTESHAAFLDQWSATTRASYYRTSEGSQLLPYAWFLALEQAKSTKPFREDANIARLGYLSDAPSASNPDGLPVGFARDDDPKTGAWVGFTCSACHTSEIVHDGVRLRIDGGPGLGDITAFLDAVRDALRSTAADDAKLTRFATKVLGHTPTADEVKRLAADVTRIEGAIDERIARNKPLYPPGHGRVDPVANIFNEIICGATHMPENCAVPKAPMKMPHLWGITELEWVQANSLAHNPLPRNISQAMGVFAQTTTDPNCSFGVEAMTELAGQGICAFRSTVRIQKMSDLERDLTELKAPKWPADLLGPIDAKVAARGKELYAKNCVDCHALPPYPRTGMNLYGRSFVPVTMVPLAEIGTDPDMARAVVDRRANPGPFASSFKQGDLDAEGKVQALQFVSFAVVGTMLNAFRDQLSITDVVKFPQFFDRRSITRLPTTEQMLAYKARPLAGTAFAGYLLHNGAVPNVYELLLPPKERSKVFFVGNREYDSKRLGFVSDKSVEGTTKFDTSLPGSSNAGHEYGTDLPDDDRWALVEYLKSL